MTVPGRDPHAHVGRLPDRLPVRREEHRLEATQLDGPPEHGHQARHGRRVSEPVVVSHEGVCGGYPSSSAEERPSFLPAGLTRAIPWKCRAVGEGPTLRVPELRFTLGGHGLSRRLEFHFARGTSRRWPTGAPGLRVPGSRRQNDGGTGPRSAPDYAAVLRSLRGTLPAREPLPPRTADAAGSRRSGQCA